MTRLSVWTPGFLAALLAATLVWPANGGTNAIPHQKGDDCRICGMYIHAFTDTTTAATFDDGEHELYCGMACILRSINEHLGLEHAREALATDWTTKQAIPLDEATLVVGSEIIPDMIPNYIAFTDADAADDFQAEHGGEIISLDKALAGVSYHGMTMPFRVAPAATPPEGVFAVAVVYARMVMDDLMQGSDDACTCAVVAKKGMAPDKMETDRSTLKLAYAATDNLVASLDVPYLWKEMQTVSPMGSQSFKNDGLGDLVLTARWRFYRDVSFDKHAGLLLRASLPTGDFDNAYRMRHGLQLGAGAPGFGAGLQYSQHVGLFWAHASAEYFAFMENSDDYRFGDVLKGGVALHYTPSTRTIIALELDAMKKMKNKDDGPMRAGDVPNSGREKVSVNLALQQRLAMFGGGNLNLRALVGAPIYEKVTAVQLGEAYHGMAALQWKRRF